MVTGATDGIGKAYALGLAKKGLNVVLISRTQSKLEEVKKEIQTKYSGIEVKVIACDYSQFDAAAQKKVQTALNDLDIGVLINNVGMSYRYPQFYDELTDEEAMQLVDMNVTSTTQMTRMVLPGMVSRKRGAICNISSGSAMYTLPLLAGYSASKSYIEKFSRAINAEYASKGVTCQCQIPFYVATKLAKMRKSFHVPTPEEYVALGMKWIGYDDDVVSPFWVHATAGWIFLSIPESTTTNFFFGQSKATRKRGLAKDANGGVSPSKKSK